MSNKIITILVLIVVVLVGSLAYMFLSKPERVVVPAPVATSTPPEMRDTISLQIPNGGTITVDDFRKNPEVVPDPSNAGYYYVSGQLGPGLPYPSYTITYKETSSGFIITLWSDPLKSMRLIAEDDFLQKIRISKQDACKLNYEVMVPMSLNKELSGQNLGFSFCPGAVALPE